MARKKDINGIDLMKDLTDQEITDLQKTIAHSDKKAPRHKKAM